MAAPLSEAHCQVNTVSVQTTLPSQYMPHNLKAGYPCASLRATAFFNSLYRVVR